ncbi:hypothetical protein Fmac_008989 [Flemingia macrophylla]|uniref:Uncharacterized protein n=1 Tax=Flemingia macrophylla TaxID=520843 RepID=A0ABD1MZ10_9FABA
MFPLVRYNELGQPICQVCNVVLMVESTSAHLATPEHIQLLKNLEANAARLPNHNHLKSVDGTNLVKANPEQPQVAQGQLHECSQRVPEHQSPEMFPPDFCDGSGKTRTISVMYPPKEQETWESNTDSARMKSKGSSSISEVKGILSRGRPRKTKPTEHVINQTFNPSSTPRRSKRIKHTAEKIVKDILKVSSSEDFMKGLTAENSQVDGKGQTSKSPSRKTSPLELSTNEISSFTTSYPHHQDPPAPALIENKNDAEKALSTSLMKVADNVNPVPSSAQDQLNEVSTVNTPLNQEAINKMIEDDPLSAIENILTGKIFISYKVPQSEPPKVQSSSAEVLLKKLKDFMETFNFGDFFTDYEQVSKALLILEELHKNEKSLSLAQQDFINAFRLFFNNAVTHLKEYQMVGMKKVELDKAKENSLLKLQEVKNTHKQITTTISNAITRVNQIFSSIQQLEEQLFKLKKERETFQLAICEGQKQRETLKNNSIVLAHRAKDLIFDLAEVEAKEKSLGEQLEVSKDAYALFRASFPL